MSGFGVALPRGGMVSTGVAETLISGEAAWADTAKTKPTRRMKKYSIIRTTALAGVAAFAGLLHPASAQVLVQQWTFNETIGTTAANSVGGGATATLMGNATFNGSGGVTLNGSGGTYVNLGGDLFAGLTSVTLEGWFSYSQTPNNVHLFAFDDGTGTGTQNGGAWNGNYLRYNVYDSGHAGGVSWVEIPNLGNPNGGVLDGTGVLLQNSLLHVALVYDPGNSLESLYVNGALQSSVSGSLAALSSISDNRGTLGASPWSAFGDAYLNGTIDQFSIYDGALSASQIGDSFAAGPVTVPEPSTFALAGIGLAGLLIFGRRK
jgi:hypothetical protein